jgi:hypothetical protein
MFVPWPKELKVLRGLGEKLDGEAPVNAANGEVATLVIGTVL